MPWSIHSIHHINPRARSVPDCARPFRHNLLLPLYQIPPTTTPIHTPCLLSAACVSSAPLPASRVCFSPEWLPLALPPPPPPPPLPRTFTYGRLVADVIRTRRRLREAGGDIVGRPVAFLVENGYDFTVTLLASLAAGSIAVPLSAAFPAPELQYILNHSQASLLVTSAKLAAKADEVLATELESTPLRLHLEKHLDGEAPEKPVSLLDEIKTDIAGASLMLYTSGTTSRPKGVVLPHSVLNAQSRSLIEAWRYTPSDRLLHVLPLNHIHGVVNALITPLVAGSSVEFMFPFNADAVWKRLAAPFAPSSDSTNRPKPVTLFTVVPTVYSRLLSSHGSLPDDVRDAARDAISPANMRLAISGSAALPTPVKEAWRDLSRGNVLLERYGMTEVGMALSCGLDFADRIDASVGWPLPSVQARLVDLDSGSVIDQDALDRSGEIQLRGPTVFSRYWRDPDATARTFVADKDDDDDDGPPWFRTGDVALRRVVSTAGLNPSQQSWARGPVFFVQGRVSADIIKTGGEKVSALEVERELLSLSEVAEAAVVAVPSGNWGQKVGAVVVLDSRHVQKWTPLDMRRALKGRLAAFKIPQTLQVVDQIPRNAMGKVNKKELVRALFIDEFSGDEK
ncbi:hypothetical protein XA68_12713 [Ophiocordyceps unilateralis]|uniref:AMP-dependent synthetase/ligase domain-containing protein n=1 Tax=Ophiocordyceps unilateralis TaxID=268505 RepID=A0A2A9PMQ2_OPHUN|nr:hypothetical protein XA68_12713 [Ophiocordyceps unilateralis]